MSDLPQSWSVAPLEILVDILDSKRIPVNADERAARIAGKASEQLYPYYGATGQVGRIDGYLFDEPLILLGEDGVPFFESARIKAYQVDGKCWVNNHAHVLRPLSMFIDRSYLCSFLNAFDYRGFVSGSTRLKLTQNAMRAIPIAVAPQNEQKRIAGKLDAVLARVDACRERLDRVPDILGRFRQAVLTAATSGKLTEDWRRNDPRRVDALALADAIHRAHEVAGGHKVGNAAPPTEDVHDLSSAMFPDGWQLLTLRDLVLPDRPITYGILKPGPDVQAGVPYLRVADFPNERLEQTTIRRTSPEIDEQFKRSRLRGGDLLMSIRGSVGRLIVIPESLEEANITQDSARLSIQSVANRDWVLWYLRSDLAQTRMKGATKGVAVRGLNIGDVRALQIPLPSRVEQDEIVRRVESLFAYADRLGARYAAARAQVERLTAALLAKAFRGELVPQDPNDEPTSVLLERIRAARAVAPPRPTRGRAGASNTKGRGVSIPGRPDGSEPAGAAQPRPVDTRRWADDEPDSTPSRSAIT